jgi:hypothetical protein
MVHAFFITLAVMAAVYLFPAIFVTVAAIPVFLWKLRYFVLVVLVAMVGGSYYSYWRGQHPIPVEQSVLQQQTATETAPTLPAPAPRAELVNPPPLQVQPGLKYDSDEWLKQQMAKWRPIEVTGQPSAGPIPVTGQP